MNNSKLTPEEFQLLVKRVAMKQKRNRLFGQGFLMLWGYGVFFSSVFNITMPENGDFIPDMAIFALFGLLVGALGTAFFLNDNK